MDAKLIGFCNSDSAKCVDDMKRTSDYAFSLGSSVFSWASKKQQTVAQSSTKAICFGIIGNFTSNLAKENFGIC